MRFNPANFLKSLFGTFATKRSEGATTYDPFAAEFIECVTADGTPVRMSRDEYRGAYLPGMFEAAWNDPDQLAAAVHSALDDDFVGEALEPARRLHQTDPQPERGVVYLAATLLRLNRAPEALPLLTAHLEQHGENGLVLTNLAKVYAETGDAVRSQQTLWRALECDPNQENAFYWYVALQGEEGGESARDAAVQKIAVLPGSWRALLFLAREALDKSNRAKAVELNRRALERAGTSPPASMLMQISGDLGRAGFPASVIELCAPVFDPVQHGLTVGNNLISAYIDVGEAAQARAVIETLRAQENAGWLPRLAELEQELDQIES